MAARRIPREVPKKYAHVSGFLLETMAVETDRGCVLVAHAGIDDALEALLREYFKKATAPHDRTKEINFLLENEPIPPIGSFGVRIRVCYVLGLFSERVFLSLRRLNDLRVAFAHGAQPVELTKKDIEKFPDIRGLSYDDVLGSIVISEKVFREHLSISESKKFSRPRMEFMKRMSVLWLEITGARQLVITGKSRPKSAPSQE
jgi:DNA-binding MltR family transcriptional regulator